VSVGSRPDSRVTFVSAKVPKTIDAQSGQIRRDERQEGADQLAELALRILEGLRQGPPNDRSVHPKSRTAGVGKSGKLEEWNA